MNTIEYFKEHFDQLERGNDLNGLGVVRRNAFSAFSKMGIPTTRHEEWKYTRISGLFNKEYQFPADKIKSSITAVDLKPIRLPGHEQANQLVFINGLFSSQLSSIRSEELEILPLEEAARHEYHEIV